MSDYVTAAARWEAYQFSDPFAATAFVCCNKRHNVVCRPSCDVLAKVASKEEIAFLSDVQQAIDSGYKPCIHCDPENLQQEVDIALIKLTIDGINASIGFTPDSNEIKKRALSAPEVGTEGHYNERQLTRNESEHMKLVALACRHIASAAAENVSKQQDQDKNQKKKRRGGVLGFKELASKSKLSPWHFHRVFKSVTGLTPKSYGDQCWKFIKNRERPQNGRTRSHFRSNSDITSSYKRRVKKEQPDGIPPLAKPEEFTPQLSEPLSFGTSLDINLAPMRHQSLDLTALSGMGSMLDMNMNSMLLPQCPQLTVPPPQPQHEFNDQHVLPQQQLHTRQQVPPQQQTTHISQDAHVSVPFEFQQQPTPPPQLSIVPNDDSSPSTTTDAASLSLYPGEETLWPSVQASTPPEDELKPGPAEFYEVIANNNSPLENVDLFTMNDYNDYTFNGEPAEPMMLFGDNIYPSQQYQEGVFDSITMLKPKGETAMDLMV